MTGNFTLLSFLYCAKTSNDRKIYIAIIFVLCEDIQCQENLHCYHFCIVRRHPMSGKSTFQSFLNCAKTSNVKKIYVVTFLHCAQI